MRVTCSRLPQEPHAPATVPPPEPQPAYKDMADAAFTRGEHSTAIGLYTLALQAHGPCAQLYGNRSATHAALKEPVRALADAMLMRHHAREERHQLKACFRLARALVACGLRRDAQRACEEGLALKPDHPQLVGLLGSCGAPPEEPSRQDVALRLKVGRGAAIEVSAPCLHGEALMLVLAELARVEDATRLRVVLKGRLLSAINICSELERAAERSQPVLLQVVGTAQPRLDAEDCRAREIEARLGLSTSLRACSP